VSLQLPDGYELIAGIQAENIHLYYELAKVSIAATSHCVTLIVSVPLKSTDRYFTLYKIVTLPEYISFNRYVQYLTDYPYFAIHSYQLDYLLFTEEQYIIALEAASLYVQYTRLFTTPRLYLVNLVCTYSIQRTTNCVKGNYCCTSNHRFFKDMAHIGFLIFPRNAKSPHAAQSPTES